MNPARKPPAPVTRAVRCDAVCAELDLSIAGQESAKGSLSVSSVVDAKSLIRCGVPTRLRRGVTSGIGVVKHRQLS